MEAKIGLNTSPPLGAISCPPWCHMGTLYANACVGSVQGEVKYVLHFRYDIAYTCVSLHDIHRSGHVEVPVYLVVCFVSHLVFHFCTNLNSFVTLLFTLIITRTTKGH